MELNKIEAAIEAVLFSLGAAVSTNKLCEVLELDKKTLKKILSDMAHKYDKEDRGIQLISLEDSYQLCSKPAYYDLIKQVNQKARELSLTDVLIETLSIIAYKQPITKTHIEEIRGVNSNHAVNRLIEYELVEEVGRMNAPGRPILFGTSKNFLRFFGLRSVDELPYLKEEDLNFLKEEAEEEVQLKLVE